jgi:hypothetical protein
MSASHVHVKEICTPAGLELLGMCMSQTVFAFSPALPQICNTGTVAEIQAMPTLYTKDNYYGRCRFKL